MLTLSSCPICGAGKFQHQLECTDYTVTKNTFKIQSCVSCGFFLTNPQPQPEDLGKYYESPKYISHARKSRSIVDIIYRISRHFTTNWKVNLIRKYISTATSLLDYGCGTGDFLYKAYTKNFKVTGIEPSTSARAQALEKLPGRIYPSLEQLNATFDAVTLWHVLEHIPDLNSKLMSIKQFLNPNGRLLIALPNHESHDALKFQQHWAGYDVPRHLWHFRKQDVLNLISKAGLELVDIVPMKLDAFYVSILSHGYQNGKSNMLTFAKGIITGLISNLKAVGRKNHSSLIYIVKKK